MIRIVLLFFYMFLIKLFTMFYHIRYHLLTSQFSLVKFPMNISLCHYDKQSQGLHSYFANLFGENAVVRSVVTQWWGLVACLEDVAGFRFLCVEHVLIFFPGFFLCNVPGWWFVRVICTAIL